MTRVVIAGMDYPPRPHMISWLARAYQRLGCEVIRVSNVTDTGVGDGDTYLDTCFAAPQIRLPGKAGRVPLGEVLAAIDEKVDLCVMVDQADNWTVVNDGSCPYAYIWREGNPDEATRTHTSANGAPMFVCMVGKNTLWPKNAEFMPFAADRMFLTSGWPFEMRIHDLIYTGRERGNGTLEGFGKKVKGHFPGYLKGYSNYFVALARSKTTYVMDSGRYIGSRGLEAMAAGCVVFWDGGDAFDRMGFSPASYLPVKSKLDVDYIPVGDFIEQVKLICSDRKRWTKISQAATWAIKSAHTYEHRAQRIADVCGVDLPLRVENLP